MKISSAKFAGSSTRVQQRPDPRLPEFAFIGRSNVGKSSLINMLCNNGKLALTSSTPGKTKVVNHFLINGSWYLVDLPGYGYASLPEKARRELREVVSDYLLNSENLAGLFVLVDCRFDIPKTDIDFISELYDHSLPFSIIFTKTDKIGPKALQEQMFRDQEILGQLFGEYPAMLCSSSSKARGREEILEFIENILNTL